MTTVARPGVTHLVSRGIARTVKFLSAISVVRHVVTPEWLEQSAMENKFLGKERGWTISAISVKYEVFVQ